MESVDNFQCLLQRPDQASLTFVQKVLKQERQFLEEKINTRLSKLSAVLKGPETLSQNQWRAGFFCHIHIVENTAHMPVLLEVVNSHLS